MTAHIGPVSKNDFGKAMTDAYTDIKKYAENKSDFDPQVKEQIGADIDRMIEKRK